MSIEGHAAAMHKPLHPEHIARQREVDARWTRTLQVGGSQGRGNPPATRYHQDEMLTCDGTPGLLSSPWFWVGGIGCLVAWIAAWTVLAGLWAGWWKF